MSWSLKNVLNEWLRAKFTNSLSQRKLFLVLKYCQDLLKTHSEELEKPWAVIFIIEYTFVGDSLSDAKFMGGEY